MNPITDLFQQAQLAEAAYAEFIDPQTGLVYTDTAKITGALIAEGMSTAQTTALSNEWSVVDQYDNSST